MSLSILNKTIDILPDYTKEIYAIERMSTEINELAGDIDALSIAYEHVTKHGYTQELAGILDVNNRMSQCVGIYPQDINGISDSQKKAIYIDGIFDAIMRGITWLIQKIVAFFKWLYTKFIGFIASRIPSKDTFASFRDAVKNLPKNAEIPQGCLIYSARDIAEKSIGIEYVVQIVEADFNEYLEIATRNADMICAQYADERDGLPNVDSMLRTFEKRLSRHKSLGFTAVNIQDVSFSEPKTLTANTLGDIDWNINLINDIQTALTKSSAGLTKFGNSAAKYETLLIQLYKYFKNISSDPTYSQTAKDIAYKECKIRERLVGYCNFLSLVIQKCLNLNLHTSDAIITSKQTIDKAINEYIINTGMPKL